MNEDVLYSVIRFPYISCSNVIEAGVIRAIQLHCDAYIKSFIDLYFACQDDIGSVHSPMITLHLFTLLIIMY